MRASKARRQGRQALRVELHRLIQLELRQVDAEDVAPPRDVRPVDRYLAVKPVRGPQVNSRLKMHACPSKQYQSFLTSMLETHYLCTVKASWKHTVTYFEAVTNTPRCKQGQALQHVLHYKAVIYKRRVLATHTPPEPLATRHVLKNTSAETTEATPDANGRCLNSNTSHKASMTARHQVI